MAVRNTPPAHAPAHGFRRQNDQGHGQHGEGHDKVGRGRGPDGEGPPGLRRKEGVRGDAAEIVEAQKTSLLSDTKTEERQRQRRLTEEEVKEQRQQTQVRETHKRRRLDGSRQQVAEEKALAVLERGQVIETHISIRAAVGRALAGLDRATSLLGSGRGAEAALVLATEATRTRAAAMEHPVASSEARILRGLGAHLAGRSEALRSLAPERAEKLATRLDRLAEATAARAARLEDRGQAVAAQLLRSVATDSRGQARLLAAGAANTEGIVGHALGDLAQKLSHVAFGRAHAGSKEAAAIAAAFGRLGEASLENRQSFHEVSRLPSDRAMLEGLARRLAQGALNRPELAALFLNRDERMGGVLRALELLSVGLSQKDPKLVERARADLQQSMRDLRALPALKDAIRAELARGTSSNFKELMQRLPEFIGSRLVDGGAAALARAGSGSLEQQLARLPGLPVDAPSLRPAERVAAELARGATSGPAQSLGPPESLILGSQGFYAELGALSAHLREQANLGVSAAGRFELPRVDRANLEVLAPVGPHESAVLVDPRGSVLVRGPGGFSFHEGHAVNRAGERYYFDTEARADGLRSIVYQSALPGAPPRVRVELDVTEADVASVSLEDDEKSKRRKKQQRREAQAAQRGAAIAIYRDRVDGSTLLGFASRVAAKLSMRELERVNATLPVGDKIRALFSDVAAGAASMLEANGAVHAASFAEHLLEQLEQHGLDPEHTSLLVFWLGSDAEDLVRMLVPGLRAPAAFIQPGAEAEAPIELERDRSRQPELVESGLLILPTAVEIE